MIELCLLGIIFALVGIEFAVFAIVKQLKINNDLRAAQVEQDRLKNWV